MAGFPELTTDELSVLVDTCRLDFDALGHMCCLNSTFSTLANRFKGGIDINDVPYRLDGDEAKGYFKLARLPRVPRASDGTFKTIDIVNMLMKDVGAPAVAAILVKGKKLMADRAERERAAMTAEAERRASVDQWIRDTRPFQDKSIASVEEWAHSRRAANGGGERGTTVREMRRMVDDFVERNRRFVASYGHLGLSGAFVFSDAMELLQCAAIEYDKESARAMERKAEIVAAMNALGVEMEDADGIPPWSVVTLETNLWKYAGTPSEAVAVIAREVTAMNNHVDDTTLADVQYLRRVQRGLP